ncbi:protein mono-ADP-ribosyltransferase PARP12-like isoform X2 [Nyctibius grandis]
MEYAWYWLDDSGQWIEYGEEHPDHCAATVTSADLEKEFLADQKGIVLFRAGSQKYELDFEDMVQTNLIYETQRRVARLPKSVSSQGGQDRSQNMALSCSVCPPQWDQSALPDIGFKLVQLSYTSREYGKIKRLFEKTMKDYCIHRLQRIQNPTLWQVFQCCWCCGHAPPVIQGPTPVAVPRPLYTCMHTDLESPSPRQREQMKKLNKSKWVDERLLFHGTSPSHMSAICEQNFDWRICGTHGTMYGKGSYFARDASYSHEYCSSHSGRYSMFVAHVLVGDFAQGNPEYLRPPPRPSNSNRLYDSCVDDLTDPSIFVIFEKHQIYPAYILEYGSEGQCMIL